MGLGTRNGDPQEHLGPRKLLALNFSGNQSPGSCFILQPYSAGQLRVLHRQS